MKKSQHPIVTARSLVRRYGKDFTAVKGIDLDIYPGEVFGLLGTNGAGKTSTLEVLEGLATASDGDVSVFGLHPIKDRSTIRPRQGVMMQSGGFPTDLTVKETVNMWGGTLTNPMPTDEALELVDMSHRANVRVSALSGGEVRRLDLACAVLGQPDLLFMDEPTTGLDPESRRMTWRLIETLRDRGTTIETPTESARLR